MKIKKLLKIHSKLIWHYISTFQIKARIGGTDERLKFLQGICLDTFKLIQAYSSSQYKWILQSRAHIFFLLKERNPAEN